MSTTQSVPTPQGQAPEPRYKAPHRAWAIVTRREIVAKLHDKAFLTSTAVTMALIIIGAVVGSMVGGRGTQTSIAVTDQQGAAIVQQTEANLKQINDKSTAKVVQVADRSAAEAAVNDGTAKAMLVNENGVWTLTFKKDTSTTVSSAVGQAVKDQTVQQLASKAGVSPAQVAKQSSLTTGVLQGDASKVMIGTVVGIAFAVLFFMSALSFGMQIAQSVAEEKNSRVVEILAAAVPIRSLLAGKVIGNTVLALAQMALIAIVAVIGVSFTQFKSFLPMVSGSIVWFLLFFIAGFLALACIWAVAGSLASRQEDLGSTTTPLTMVLTIAYVAGFVATGTVKTVLSFVPVISSVLMPGRLVSGDATWWEALIALLLNIAFAAVAVKVGEKIYRRSLLQNSGKISYRDALKLTD